jgi:hypothetical protein
VDNIKMDLGEIGWGGVDSIDLAQDMDKWRALVSVVMNLLKTPWPESASELYGPSCRHLSVKLMPTFADKVCHVVQVSINCWETTEWLHNWWPLE